MPLPTFLRACAAIRLEIALVAALASGVCGLAGLYPRVEDGPVYRLVLGLTSAGFGAAVVLASLGARTRVRAVAGALFLSTMLGIVSTVLPAAILASEHHSNPFLGVVFFGPLFGGPTGLAYGVPLAVLAAIAHGRVEGSTRDGDDRLARDAALWSIPIALVALVASMSDLEMYAQRTVAEPPDLYGEPSMLPVGLPVAAVLFAVGIVRAASAQLRLVRRRRWLARVLAGGEPGFRVRPLEASDVPETLIRVSPGRSVLEWSEGADEVISYRELPPKALAVALVGADEPAPSGAGPAHVDGLEA